MIMIFNSTKLVKLMKNDNFHRKKKSSDYLVKVLSPWKNQASLIEKGSFYSCGRDKLYLICSKLLPSLSQKSNVLLHCLEPNASTYLLHTFVVFLSTGFVDIIFSLSKKPVQERNTKVCSLSQKSNLLLQSRT